MSKEFKVTDGNYIYLIKNNEMFSTNFDGTISYKVAVLSDKEKEELQHGKTVVLNHQYDDWQKDWAKGIQYSVKKIN